MRTLVLTLAAAFALGGAAAAQTYGPSPEPSPAATAAASAAPAASPEPSPATSTAPSTTDAPPPGVTSVRPIVHVRDFAFVPQTLTVMAGQSVLFIQDDPTPHTVTAADKSYDSGNLGQHATWAHAFAKPGTYAYVCAYHPNMKGTIVVK